MASSKRALDEKPLRIIQAAIPLFSRYGFRRTSVDSIARAAGIAKPTLYAHFEDKEAIFQGVVEAVCDELLSAARVASRLRAPIEERLAAILSAKFTRYFELVAASPHAQELIASHGALGREPVERLDQEFLRLLIDVIESEAKLETKRIGLSSRGAALLLLRAASGASYDATTAAKHRSHLSAIVRAIVAAMKRRR